MKTHRFTHLFFGLLCSLGAPAVASETITLTSLFDNSGFNDATRGIDPNTIVGFGTLTYSGPEFEDGSYAFNSFNDLTIDISFGDLDPILFTLADLESPTNDVSIVIIAGTFQFSGPGLEDFRNGSTSWLNEDGYIFSTTPSDAPFFGYAAGNASTPEYFGFYGVGGGGASAVPEPSSYASLAGGLMLGITLCRRRGRTTPTDKTLA